MSASSLFCPVIVDVKSVKMEPEDVPASSTGGLDEPCSSGSHVHSDCNNMANLTIRDLQVPSSSASCFTSDSFNSSLVTLRPLASFSAAAPAAAADNHLVSHSVVPAVVKQEFLPAEHSSLLSLKDSAVAARPNSTRLSARNLTETSGNGNTEFADRHLTADCSEVKLESVKGCDLNNVYKSSKTAAGSSDIVSAPGKTETSKKSTCSRAANVDSSLKGKRLPSTERLKSDICSRDNSLSQSGNEKLSSLKMESRKRKFRKTAETGMHTFSC